ncbi:MAG: HAMP domain-containing protein, partial [Bdellovibrionales bacterium]|nr:HAMP domain-containing protein [Bdellovibrionales bacterium]
EISSALLNSEDIDRLFVLAGDEKVLFASQPIRGDISVDSKLEQVDDGIFDYSSPILFENERIGQVIIGTSTKPVEEALTELRSRFIIFALPGMLITAIFSWLLGTGILKTITRLIEVTQQVGKGDLTVRIEIKEKNELALLAKNFNLMIGQIDHLNKEQQKSQEQMVLNNHLASLGEISAGIGHEINNPLTVIKSNIRRLGKLGLTGDENLEEKVKETAYKIEFAIDRIQKIMLSLRRMSSASKDDPAQAALVDVKTIVEDVLVLTMDKYRSGGVKLEISPIPDKQLRCNPVDISRVLINLLNNALHASQDAKAETVELKAIANNEGVNFQVIDNGPGVKEENMDKLFVPFFTTKAVGQGVGIGLHLSAKTITQHDSELKYLRQNSQTIFEFTLKYPPA